VPRVPLALPLEQDLQGALPLILFPLEKLRLRPLPFQRCGGRAVTYRSWPLLSPCASSPSYLCN
jgi:hypothetical protein